MEDASSSTFTFTDHPKVSLRVVPLAIWGVTAFFVYKAVTKPPETWTLWSVLGFFLLTSLLVIREFGFRPIRVTTIHVPRREVVVEESAPLRQRRIVTAIPAGCRFETFEADNENPHSWGVRFRSPENRWVTVAEYLPRLRAEELASTANWRLTGR